jgi:hypothetical protein
MPFAIRQKAECEGSIPSLYFILGSAQGEARSQRELTCRSVGSLSAKTSPRTVKNFGF